MATAALLLSPAENIPRDEGLEKIAYQRWQTKISNLISRAKGCCKPLPPKPFAKREKELVEEMWRKHRDRIGALTTKGAESRAVERSLVGLAKELEAASQLIDDAINRILG